MLKDCFTQINICLGFLMIKRFIKRSELLARVRNLRLNKIEGTGGTTKDEIGT